MGRGSEKVENLWVKRSLFLFRSTAEKSEGGRFRLLLLLLLFFWLFLSPLPSLLGWRKRERESWGQSRSERPKGKRESVVGRKSRKKQCLPPPSLFLVGEVSAVCERRRRRKREGFFFTRRKKRLFLLKSLLRRRKRSGSDARHTHTHADPDRRDALRRRRRRKRRRGSFTVDRFRAEEERRRGGQFDPRFPFFFLPWETKNEGREPPEKDTWRGDLMPPLFPPLSLSTFLCQEKALRSPY